MEAVEDPTFVENIVAGIVEAAGFVLEPLIAANEWVQEGWRAGAYRQAQDRADGLVTDDMAWQMNLSGFAYGFFADRDKVGIKDINESYIQQIRDSGEYSERQIDIALEVFKGAVSGAENPITAALVKYGDDPEAVSIMRDIAYSRAEGNTQELLRQIDSAYLGNVGQVYFGAADQSAEYDPFRGSEFRQDLANATAFGISLATDPTLFFGKGVKTYKAFMWGLDRLAPGAGSASQVLAKGRLGRLGLENPAYRYMKRLADDLNNLDDLEKRAAAATGDAQTNLKMQAAAYRNRMTRQYDELPEDLIEDFRTSPWRNVDGKFDVEHMAAAIDDMNDAFVVAAGGVADKLAIEGATEAARAAALQELYAQASFMGRVIGTNQKRTALVPRMTLARMLRINAVNRLAFSMSPQKNSQKMIAEFLNTSGDAALFSESMSDNALSFGQAAREQKFTSGLADSAARMFSSIPTARTISVSSAEDTKEVYRYARMFFSKRTAELVAEQFRTGTEGSRRLLLSGLVRSAAASRGLTLQVRDADELTRVLTPRARGLMTGSMEGEQYAITVRGGLKPSERAEEAKRVAAEKRRVESELRSQGVDDSEIAAALAAIDDEFAASLNQDIRRSLSADFNDIEHAIHLNQTADNVALPTIKDFEDLRNGLRTGITEGAQTVTDWWSLLTLFGLRFSMRNAIEELGLYWLTGGRIVDLYRGRKASQAIRRARPRIFIENIDGQPTPVLRTSLGMVANKAEWTSRRLKEWSQRWGRYQGLGEWTAELIFRGADPEALKAAGVALAQGNPDAFARLAIESLATQRVFGFSTNLMSVEDRLAIRFLVDSTHGMSQLDEIGEAAPYLNSGGFPAYASSANGIDEAVPGVEYGKIRDFRFGDYGNVPPIGRDEAGRDVFGLAFWWRGFQETLDGDGPIGEAAVRGLLNPQQAKAEIAAILRADTTFRYKERFSRLRSDADIDQFADDYFENVFQMFTKEDGTLNVDLRARFMSVDDNGNPVATFWEDLTPDELNAINAGEWSDSEMLTIGKKSGLMKARVGRNDLNAIRRPDRPEFIFGRDVIHEPYIPNAMNASSLLTERAWAWMGRQNARISREPIFIANYLQAFRQTAEARESLARSIATRNADEGADVVVTEAHRELADLAYSRMAMDDAYSRTLAYVDNPANRSNLAWKVRNMSRYYRATEDFYRRLKRIGRNDPLALWKGALTYQLLGDFGFTYTNDSGEQYFAYPGNQLVINALAGGVNIPGTDIDLPGLSSLWGIDFQQYADLNPFSLNARMLGISPSTDPNQLAPSLAGPVVAPVAGFLSAFPQFQGIRTIVFGQYNQSTGNPLADAINAALPAGVTRILRTSNQEWVDSQIAQAGVDTMALMAAERMLDRITIGGKPYTNADGVEIPTAMIPFEEFQQTDQYQASQAIALSLFTVKLIGGWTLPAAPQGGSDTASEFAKRYGIDSMDDLYKDLLDEKTKAGDPAPFESALSAFYSMKINELNESGYASFESMLPFTVSQYKDNPDKKAQMLATIRTTDDWFKWLREDSTKDLQKRYQDVYLFLSPQTGEFAWPAWTAATTALDLKVKKSEAEQVTDLFAIVGEAEENRIKRYYEAEMLNDPENADTLSEEMAAAVALTRSQNPWWRRKKENFNTAFASAENVNSVMWRVTDMLRYVEKRDGSLDADAQAIQNAIDIYHYYRPQMDGLQGTSAERSRAKKSLQLEMASNLDWVKGESDVAKRFIETVIESDPDYTYGVQ
jgi:hypothetical protein